ncbi:MAG: O-antigen ligase C-terminal domain-containing protein, partial [Anaerolineae bacterium]|nr:O-antigen ligase C-terminal domain-containing protein [Anaerolineae bacterium]
MTVPRQRIITLLIVPYVTFVGGTAYAHTGALPDTIRLLIMAGPLTAWLLWLIRQRRAFPRTALDNPLVLAAAWWGIAAVFALDRRISLEIIGPLLLHVLAFYTLVDLIRKGWAAHFKLALLVVAVLIVLISGVEIAVWYAGWFPIGGLSDPVPPTLPHLDLALNITTIQGNYIAVLIPLIAVGMLASRNWRARVGLGVLVLALLAVEVLTFSRGGLLGALVGIGLLFAFGTLRWQQRTGRLAGLLRPRIILGGALIAVIGAGLVIMVWTSGSSRSDSDQGRLDTWRSALEMTQDHPVTGVGPGLFGLALRSYRDPELAQDKLVSAHNLFLNTLAETGIPGLLLLAWVILAGGRAWWKSWRAAAPERRLWLEGALTALVAYGVHSLVDTFPLTSSVLPLVILAAYTVAEPVPEAEPIRPGRTRLAWACLVVMALYGAWIVRLDVSQGFMTLSRAAISQGDLDTALTHAERARTWDPDLSLYDLHHAYVLGLLVNEQPEIYLDRAIAAHESALEQQPTFDLGWANLSALYAQRGDDPAARLAMQRAAAINPSEAAYWLQLGDGYRAVEENNDLAEYADRVDPAGVARFLADETIPVGRRLYVAVLAGDQEAADVLILQAEREGGWLAHLALGLAAHRLVGDDDQALVWLNKAAAERPVDERAALERAEIHLARGDLDVAEKDARAALFVDPY